MEQQSEISNNAARKTLKFSDFISTKEDMDRYVAMTENLTGLMNGAPDRYESEGLGVIAFYIMGKHNLTLNQLESLYGTAGSLRKRSTRFL